MPTSRLLGQTGRITPESPVAIPTTGDEIAEQMAWGLQWLTQHGPRTGIILAFSIGVYLLISKSLRALQRGSKISSSDVATLRIVVRWAMVLLTFAALLQAWGVLQNVWAAATTMVALVAIGFVAVWSVLSNILCSFVLLSTRPFRIGEWVAFVGEEVQGRVEAITLTYVALRDEEDGSQVLVPNNLFFQKSVRRYPGGGAKRRGKGQRLAGHDAWAKQGVDPQTLAGAGAGSAKPK